MLSLAARCIMILVVDQLTHDLQAKAVGLFGLRSRGRVRVWFLKYFSTSERRIFCR